MKPNFPILQTPQAARGQSIHNHPHEQFAGAAELESQLRATVRGEVRFDRAARALYATDASNYRQVPIGLVIPRDAEDVIATLAACRDAGAAVLSRGGGTSLAGQGCNVAVVIDFSKYMHRLLTLDPEGERAEVEPGIVLDTLRDAAEQHALTFAPDPATHSRCTIGGMIGNNSCGVHGLLGGKTVDNIESLDVLLYGGTRMTVGATTEEELRSIIAEGGRKGEIYAGLERLRDQYATLIRERFPDIPRRVSGLNLDWLLPENGFNVARALVGSEGTCVTILKATCRLVKSPQCRRLVVLGFENGFVAADHVPDVLQFKPIGLEGFDQTLLDAIQKKGLAPAEMKLLPPGGGFLLCEFGANSNAEAEAQAQRLMDAVGEFSVRPSSRLYTSEQARRIWKVRESALGATVFVPGQPSAWEGWEDAAVPPERLGVYLREIFALIERYNYRSPMYGHFGQGCVHLRITFDFKTVEGVQNYRRFIEEAADIVVTYGGSFSGEHGDGQSRAVLLPKMFGPELMQAFVDFKSLWDPLNRMNPGKLVDPRAVYDPIENLRHGPGHQSVAEPTFFSFAADGGSFAEATERCVGVGACRKQNSGTMCPSYMVTLEEQHSTRGRAHLLWELMNGDTLPDRWQNKQVKEALDLCLSCKACKTECPVSVDMASWKAEFLAHYHEHTRHHARDYAFGFMDRWARLGSIAPGLANLGMSAMEGAIKSALGVAKQRHLPRLAKRNFRSSFKSASSADVLLWPDTWNNYFQPHVLDAAAKVLTSAGMQVSVPNEHVCCGRPLYDFGFLKEAKSYLAKILDRFEPQIMAGTPVVMLEPSCASVFQDELLNFFPTDERAQRLARQTRMIGSILIEKPTWQPPALAGRRVVVHGHCHQKSIMSMQPDMALLQATGADVTLLDSGCCGMAGPFGFESEKFAVSQALGERVLLPAVRAAGAQDLVVSNGFSCREQITQNRLRGAKHLVEVLAMDL